MKITEQTTLAELAIERARLGIEEMSIHINTKGARTCAVFGNGRGCQVAGATEAEAIDAAFRKFELAAAGSEGQARFERLLAVNEVDHDARLRAFHGLPVKPEHAPLPPGEYKATFAGDPLGERTATISEGEHAGKQIEIPAPTPYYPPAGLITPAMPGGPEDRLWNSPPPSSERCNVPMCGESGVCAACRARGAK